MNLEELTARSISQESAEPPNKKLPMELFAILLVALIAARVLASIIFPIYDDAFITYRYARNLASGQGFVYHPGEWVLGATCPAFGVFTALLYALGLPVPRTMTVINIACDAVTFWLTFRILTSRIKSETQALLSAVLFGLCFAVSPIMSRVAVGGMEMNIYLLLSLTAILLYHRGSKIPAVALAAFCYFLRPEGVLLVAILCGLELISTKKLQALRLPAMALAVMVPLLVLIYRYYGHILPQSVMAKSQTAKPSVLITAKALLVPDPISGVLLLLAIWGFVVFIRENGFRKNGVLRTLAVWSVLYVAAYLAARPHIWSWYTEPIQYVALVFAALGGANLLSKASGIRKSVSRVSSPPAWLGASAAALVVCFWALIWVKQGPSGATSSIYKPLESWTKQHNLRKSTILAEDIGVIGYYSDAYIYDTAGLVWPPALKFKGIEPLIDKYKPQYLFLIARSDNIEMLRKRKFAGIYQPVKRYSATHQTSMKMDPKQYSDYWTQDYLLFKRRESRN